MAKQMLSEQMYCLTGRSMPQRVTLAAALACCVALAWWLLFFGGAAVLGHWSGHRWPLGNLARRAALAAALSIYFVRVLFTEFVFLKRGVSWTEVLTIAPWVFAIYALLALAGGTNAAPFGAVAIAGAVLFILGSWMNSWAEHQRHAFKLRAENRGKLYTEGLFRLVRHPNYLGDLISFSGLCFMAGPWFTAIVPALMLCGFVFANIPALDAHLSDHYGPDFDQYARRTRKLIPFLY
ncbi:MAG: methyltransferase family protein [Terracidiphilus sp.]